MKPTIALCMAGLYRRFRDAGYTTPKYLLPLEGKPILAHVADDLAEHDGFLAVANVRDQGFEAAIRACLPDGARVEFIGDTSGQAETADVAARYIEEQGWGHRPLLFHNVDTLVRGRDLTSMARWLTAVDGVIDVFASTSPAFSYVDAAPDGRVSRIVEKVVIGPWATSGLYGFRSASHYRKLAARTTARSGGEFYISDVYGRLMDDGGHVLALPARAEDTIVLGTPAEYEAKVGVVK